MTQKAKLDEDETRDASVESTAIVLFSRAEYNLTFGAAVAQGEAGAWQHWEALHCPLAQSFVGFTPRQPAVQANDEQVAGVVVVHGVVVTVVGTTLQHKDDMHCPAHTMLPPLGLVPEGHEKLEQAVGVVVVRGVVVTVVGTTLQHCAALHQPIHTFDPVFGLEPEGQEKLEQVVGVVVVQGVVVTVVITKLQHKDAVQGPKQTIDPALDFVPEGQEKPLLVHVGGVVVVHGVVVTVVGTTLQHRDEVHCPRNPPHTIDPPLGLVPEGQVKPLLVQVAGVVVVHGVVVTVVRITLQHKDELHFPKHTTDPALVFGFVPSGHKKPLLVQVVGVVVVHGVVVTVVGTTLQQRDELHCPGHTINPVLSLEPEGQDKPLLVQVVGVVVVQGVVVTVVGTTLQHMDTVQVPRHTSDPALAIEPEGQNKPLLAQVVGVVVVQGVVVTVIGGVVVTGEQHI